MRIIGGHDYYDKFVQYGVDNKIILNRNNTIKYNNENLSIEIEKIYKISSEPIYIKDLKNSDIHNLNYTNYKKNDYSLSAGFVTVIIGDNEYRGISLLVENRIKYEHTTHYIWDIESFNKHLNKFNCVHTWVPKSYYSKGITEEYFNLGIISSKIYDFMIKNEISIITGTRAYRETSWQFNECNLSDVEFFKKLDGYEVYQNLSHWVGNILLPSKQMPDITDDRIKIHKHGFDKWSFRKIGKK